MGIQCIVPPHIVDSIRENGSDLQKEVANVNMEMSESIRAQRSEAAPPAPSAAAAMAGKDRVVYTANNTTQLPGTQVRAEGEPATNDLAADEAYDGAGHTYDLFNDIYGRRSLDGNDMRLISTVHYGRSYDNAFWNGQQMAYGDGDSDLPPDQALFNRFTASLDVIGHELTHGVTSFSANLVYRNQSGALNESFSDVFGVLVSQRVHNVMATDHDWLIGADLLTDNVNGSGIRSMASPGMAYDDPVLGKDPQPAHMSDYVNTSSDNGGVHINSGIPNKAFHGTAMWIGGYAWEKAGLIWYKTLTGGQLSSTASFQECADLTYAVAATEFGVGSREHEGVKAGWDAVGIDVGAGTPPPGPGPTPPNGGGGGPGCSLFWLRWLGLYR